MPKKSLYPKTGDSQNQETKLSFRIDLSNNRAIGPGKIKLLELVGELGSISSAGKALKMSYRRAWLLIDDLNHSFKKPVVVAKQGGKGGGNAELTTTGKNIIKHYRLIETDAKNLLAKHIEAIEKEI